MKRQRDPEGVKGLVFLVLAALAAICIVSAYASNSSDQGSPCDQARWKLASTPGGPDDAAYQDAYYDAMSACRGTP